MIMTKSIKINLSEDIIKRLEEVAAIDGKDVKEVAEKIVAMYVGRYENHVHGVMRAVENIKKGAN